MWLESLSDSENFSAFADQCYQQHKQSQLPDYIYHGNLLLDTEFLNSLDFAESLVFKKHSLISAKEFPRLGKIHDAFNDNVYDTAIIDDNHDVSVFLKKQFNLKTIFISVHRQHPNNIVGIHKDSNKSLIAKHQEDFLISKLKKYIVFVTPWSEGQVFMLGRSAYTNWNVGDVISFEWFMPHATANASTDDRCILFVSGVEN